MSKQDTGRRDRAAHQNAIDPLGANTEIGRKLKQYYDDLVSVEVPDRFSELLRQLERAEPAGGKD